MGIFIVKTKKGTQPSESQMFEFSKKKLCIVEKTTLCDHHVALIYDHENDDFKEFMVLETELYSIKDLGKLSSELVFKEISH